MDGSCPFCDPDRDRVFLESDLAFALWDGFPVSEGHALVIPRRHVASWFDTTPAEREAIFELVDRVRETILERHAPQGFNVGINVGEAAGQTVFHLHVHVIPRYHGDVADPTGGVRYVIPERANYRKGPAAGPGALPRRVRTGSLLLPDAPPLVAGGDLAPLHPHLRHALARADEADLLTSFAMASGVELLSGDLAAFLDRGGSLRVLTGDYLGVTEPLALRRLTDLAEDRGDRAQVRVFQAAGTSFHAKAWLFRRHDGQRAAFVGSSNLSRSALTAGAVEWNYRVIPAHDREGIDRAHEEFERLWDDPRSRPVTDNWIRVYELRRPARPHPRNHPRPGRGSHLVTERGSRLMTDSTVQHEALDALTATRAAGNGLEDYAMSARLPGGKDRSLCDKTFFSEAS